MLIGTLHSQRLIEVSFSIGKTSHFEKYVVTIKAILASNQQNYQLIEIKFRRIQEQLQWERKGATCSFIHYKNVYM